MQYPPTFEKLEKQAIMGKEEEKEEEVEPQTLYSGIPSHLKKEIGIDNVQEREIRLNKDEYKEFTLTNLVKTLISGSQITSLSWPQFITRYMVYPLLSGVFAGVGEMCACELFILWGWRSGPALFIDRH